MNEEDMAKDPKYNFEPGRTKATPEEVERYINAAESELGPACGDDFAEWCAKVLREAASRS